MRITRVSVDGLFGLFSYDIELKLRDHITIIHGPNGVGKTTVLRLLHGLFGNQSGVLRAIPFRALGVSLSDGGLLSVTKSTQSDFASFVYSRPGSDTREHVSRLTDSDRIAQVSMISAAIPEVERVGSDVWRRTSDGAMFDAEDLVEEYGDTLRKRGLMGPAEPDWLAEIRNSIDVKFIRTQRLAVSRPARVSYREPVQTPAVMDYSKQLARTITDQLTVYATTSQSLDQSFPFRLVKRKPDSSLSIEELRARLGGLEAKRQKFMGVGLLDKAEHLDVDALELNDLTKGVLSVYTEDTETKLGKLDEMASKIDAFISIINRRFLYKTLSVSRDKGFSVQDDNRAPLRLEDLSSGEQHEIVVLFDLIFKTRENTLVLIDEPELSLHVAWQSQFLDDLQSIIKMIGFDVMIATHSPEIIGEHWDLTVALDGSSHE